MRNGNALNATTPPGQSQPVDCVGELGVVL